MTSFRGSIANWFFILAMIVWSPSPVQSQDSSISSSPIASPTQPQLAEELLQRMQEDQAVRQLWIDLFRERKGKSPDEAESERAAITAKVQAVDERNRHWLADKIKELGWPGKSIVGEPAAHAAWLLVQHADADVEFQEMCLEKMKAAKPGEVARIDIAYLSDRILVARGRPQIYGTQCIEVAGRFQPRECIEPEKLDQRRQEMGLPPIQEYLEQMEKVYHDSEEQGESDR